MYEKIAEQASDIIKIQQRQEYEVELRAENFEFLKTEIYQNKKFVDDLREKHLLMMNDFHDLEEHIKEMQIKIVTDMKTSTTKLANLIEVLNDKLNSTDSMSITNNTKTGLQEIQIIKLKEDIEILKEKSVIKWKEISDREETFQSKIEFDNYTERFQTQLNESINEHERLLNRIMTIENYADKYIPIKIQNSILDALREVKEYEEKVNKIIHATVLNDQGIADLDSKKKNIKEERKSANESASNNDDGDDINQTENKFIASDQFGNQRESLINEDILKESNEEFAEERIDRQLDSSSSKEGLIAKDFNNKLDEIVKQVVAIEERINSLDSRINISSKDSKSNIDRWRSEIEAYISELHCEIDEHSRINKTFQVDVYERFKTQRKVTGDLSTKVTQVYRDMKKYRIDSKSEKEETIRLDV